MQILYGKSVCKGIAAGAMILFHKRDQPVIRRVVQNTEAEFLRYKLAKEKARIQLQELYEKAVIESGESAAAIFEAHQMMLEDEDYQDSVYNAIYEEHVNAEYAVKMTGETFSERFENMEDDYLKARADDVKDISVRLIDNLLGNEMKSCEIRQPSVIVADDLTPGETAQIDKDKVLALVMVHGSVNSHTAVLARMMGVPALVSVPVEFGELCTGMYAVVDGYRGELVIEPDEEYCVKMQKNIQAEKDEKERLQTLKGKADITQDGRKISIFANIGCLDDIRYVIESDARGIGLFRSEFLYMGKEDFPTEEEQFQVYKEAALSMEGKPVIIRTIDVGADKQISYFHLKREENPAMGYRGIRICLDRPEIFKIQLRALFRAAVYGDIAVMYPMIISVKEIEEIKKIVDEVEEELIKAEVPYRIPKQGVMIETPAAVMVSDELAKAVDFFSIGTNDLTQYTLAADRQNEKVEELYQPRHKAVLRMIRIAADNAHRNGIEVGICGELAADTEMTALFVEMGIDELSVTPSKVLELRGCVRGLCQGRRETERSLG